MIVYKMLMLLIINQLYFSIKKLLPDVQKFMVVAKYYCSILLYRYRIINLFLSSFLIYLKGKTFLFFPIFAAIKPFSNTEIMNLNKLSCVTFTPLISNVIIGFTFQVLNGIFFVIMYVEPHVKWHVICS